MKIDVRALATGALAALVIAAPASAQARGGGAPESLPSIEEKTEGMRRIDGYFPLYWDEELGQLWMEISRFDTEELHITGIGAGLGSNDIGIDRGGSQGSRIVEFERIGRKILMVQPNYDYRASSTNASEVVAVRDAFARSVLWSFTAAAETGDRVLVDMSDFLLRDATNLAPRLRPGTYRLDTGRSSVYLPMTMNFPENTEMEVELTFVQQPGGGGGGGFGGGSGAFAGVNSVAATGEAASIRLHHSFVKLPDPGYEPRAYDPRAGFGGFSYEDYSAPLEEPMTQRFIRRHRLEKRDPSQAMGEPVEPIVYYLDPGTPEPIRSALLEGARWWNQAYEAAGYRNAFQVEIRPDSISSHDVRYNVINWVHRSTRGWSSGASVTDPRTGEIIKGLVTLGSLRWRQDYMIAEGLLSPYETGSETPPELTEWALARIRQLSAHEVGHTLGLGHNYYDSEAGRISVMDYPHPLITVDSRGNFDFSEVYDVDIGEWDRVAIDYGYRDFPEGVDEGRELRRILDEAWADDVRYMSNQDIALHPRADQWSNGTDAAAELDRMLEVRRVALSRFGERAIKTGMPMAMMEEVLVPLYLHHRYQVDAAASVLGGVDYVYSIRGDDRRPFTRPSGDAQRAALRSLVGSIEPRVLALPEAVVNTLPPRPAGYGSHRELFPRYTGDMFDLVSPAVVAADHVVGQMLEEERAARLVEQHAVDPSLPGLLEVIDALYAGSFGARVNNAYEAEISRAVERVIVDRLMRLADGAEMPQVRAEALLRLEQRAQELMRMASSADEADRAHYGLLVRDIQSFRSGELAVDELPGALVAPPGAPIGEPALDWLGRLEPWCSWQESGRIG